MTHKRLSRTWLWIGLTVAGCRDESGPGAQDELTIECAEGLVADRGVCVPLACGSGAWGDLEAAEGALYVDGTAERPGDGSADSPYQTLGEALDAVAGGGGSLVLVGSAPQSTTYLENLALGPEHAGLVLAGRCPDLVVLDGSAPGNAAVISVEAEDDTEIELSGLTLTGGYRGLAVWNGQVTGSNLTVVDNARVGVISDGTQRNGWSPRLSLRDSRILGTVPADDTHPSGVGVAAQWGGAAELVSCEVTGNAAAGVLISDPSIHGRTVRLEDVVVADTVADEEEEASGAGVLLQYGATAELVDVRVTNSHLLGLGITQDETVVELERVTISGGSPEAPSVRGRGMQVDAGTVSGSELTIEGAAGAGLQVHGGYVDLSDVQVSGTLANADGEFGHGIDVSGGALTIDVCSVADVREVGVFVEGAGSLLTLTGDSSVRGIATGGSGYGTGVAVQDGGVLVAEQVAIEEAVGLALRATGDGASATIGQVDISATAESSEGVATGMAVFEGGGLYLALATVRGGTHAGLLVSGAGAKQPSVAQVDWLEVSGVESVGDVASAGVAVIEGGSATVAGGLISAVDGFGALSQGDSRLELTGMTFQGSETRGSSGVIAWDGARARVSNSDLGGFSGAGLVGLGEGSELELADVTVTATGDRGGAGVVLGSSASGTLERVELQAAVGVGLLAFERAVVAASFLDVTDVGAAEELNGALAAVAVGGASLSLEDYHSDGTQGPGVASLGGAVDCTRCAVDNSAFAGLLLLGGALTVSDSTVTGVVDGEWLDGSLGLAAQDLTSDTSLSVQGLSISDVEDVGMYLEGAGTYSVSGLEADGAGTGRFGLIAAGTEACAEDAGLCLSSSRVEGWTEVGLVFAGALGDIEDLTLSDNQLDLLVQECPGDERPTGIEAVADRSVCPTYDEILPEPVFDLTGETVGNLALPLEEQYAAYAELLSAFQEALGTLSAEPP